MLDLEAEIAALLDELSSAQSELLDVLAKKRAALGTADVVRLTELQPREEALLVRLADCQQRRTALLAEAKQQGQPATNIATLATKAQRGKTNSLGQRVKDTAARTRLLQHHSLAN